MTATNYRTKRDLAADAVRNEIISGRLEPGSRLILDELSQKFGLSLTPIREALPVLEGEGLVVQSPHKGAIVAPMDREEVLELYAIRIGMETMVTRQAVSKLSDDDITGMAGLVGEMERLDGKWEHFLERDRKFHLILYRAAHCNRWLRTIETLWHRSNRYMIVTTAMSGAIARIHNDHRELLSACKAGDAEAAASITAAHLSSAQDRLLNEWS